MSTVMTLTGKSANTVNDWLNMCREARTSIVSRQRQQKMVRTDTPIQIDEARFAGRQKYQQGRMLNGGKALPSENSDADQENNINHGHRIDGPWVFGLKQGSDCRYFWMEWHDRNTLIPIERECAYGKVINSDKQPAYSNLNAMGYQHSTVNRQQHYYYIWMSSDSP